MKTIKRQSRDIGFIDFEKERGDALACESRQMRSEESFPAPLPTQAGVHHDCQDFCFVQRAPRQDKTGETRPCVESFARTGRVKQQGFEIVDGPGMSKARGVQASAGGAVG